MDLNPLFNPLFRKKWSKNSFAIPSGKNFKGNDFMEQKIIKIFFILL
jgi:hypothetical protein